MSVIPIKNSLSKKKKKIYPKESNCFNLQLKQSHKAFPKANRYILTTELPRKSLLTYLLHGKSAFYAYFSFPSAKCQKVIYAKAETIWFLHQEHS